MKKHLGNPITGKAEDKVSGQGNLYEEDEIEEISYSEKLKFSEKLKHLAPDELGQIVQIILNDCPKGFKEVDGDRAQIMVDNLDINTFRKLNEEIDNMSNDVDDKVSKKIKAEW